MNKVSIGLRGWRFSETAVFDETGNFRPLDEIPEEARQRLVRLVAIYDSACDACWLASDEDEPVELPRATVVYGEPLAEITLCDTHEADFLYWYRENGGSEYRGTERFQEEFHRWFADGNRAPAGYEGLEYVQTDPEAVPDPAIPEDRIVTVQTTPAERDRIDLHDRETLEAVFGPERADEILDTVKAGDSDDELNLDGVDLDVDYSP